MTLPSAPHVRFSGKNVVITGGADGIGKAAALHFAAEGARLAIIDRNAGAGFALTAEMRGAGHDVSFYAADVANDGELDGALASSFSALGKVDILFNHAGTVTVAPFAQTSDADFDHVMAVNLRAAFRVCRTAVNWMLASGGGSIVVSSSICATRAFDLESAYCMSKAALVMLVKSIASEYRDRHIRANAICPAFVKTSHGISEIEAFRSLGIDWTPDAVASLQGRMCTVDEVARAVLFLSSDDAKFVSGIDLHVDNGWSARGG